MLKSIVVLAALELCAIAAALALEPTPPVFRQESTSRDSGCTFSAQIGAPLTTTVDQIVLKTKAGPDGAVTDTTFPVPVELGWTAAQKTACIANAVNGTKGPSCPGGTGAPLVRAGAFNDVLVLVGQGGNLLIGVHVVNRSKQWPNSWSVLGGGGSSGSSPAPELAADVVLEGTATGLDPDGRPSSVGAGTRRYLETVHPAAGDRPDTILETIRAGLEAHGVTVRRDGDTLYLTLTAKDRKGFTVGSNDAGLELSYTLEFRE